MEVIDKEQVLNLLKAHKSIMEQRFGVTCIALFGSTVRDETFPHSDVDILVSFEGPTTSKQYFGVQFYLEELIGSRIDLVTDKALRPELRPYVENEAIYV